MRLSVRLLGALLGLTLASPSLAAQDPLARARTALEREKTEDVLFALLGYRDSEGAKEAAALLAGAAQLALEGEDTALAMQLCQMSLAQDSTLADALVTCARASHRALSFGPAEKYVETLRASHPADPRGPMLQARLMIDQGEWAQAYEASMDAAGHSNADESQRQRAQRLARQAQTELTARHDALSKVGDLAAAMKEARRAMRNVPTAIAARTSTNVVLYSTAWCGYCTRARRYLQKKNVDFVEKDIEKDEGAKRELAGKAARAGVSLRGVPVIDVKGDLLLGWSQGALRKALKKHRLIR